MPQVFGHLKPFLCFIVIVIACISFADRSARGEYLSPGNHTVTLTHGTRERSAIVHVPLRAIDAREIPVIVNFHGGGGHGANEQEYSLMDRLADRETFVAVYPNGSGRFGNRLLTWNAGTCCAYAALNGVDDVGFVRALVGRLAESIPIDRRRIYATGLSNGAMMSHRLAAEAADLIAAIAPMAGGMVVSGIKSTRAVPVMHIHSVDDPRALYNGGLGLPFPLTKSQVFHPNIDHMIARWAKHNGCAAEPTIEDRRSMATAAVKAQLDTFTRAAATAPRSIFGSLPARATSGPAASKSSWSISSVLRPKLSTPTRRCGNSSSASLCHLSPSQRSRRARKRG